MFLQVVVNSRFIDEDTKIQPRQQHSYVNICLYTYRDRNSDMDNG